MSRHLSIVAVVVAAALAALTCVTARATVVNVDINAFDPSLTAAVTYQGLGAAPDAPTNDKWNGVNAGNNNTAPPPLTSGSLLASDGTTNTGITFTLGNYQTQNQLASFGNNGGITVALDLFGDDVIALGNSNTVPGTLSINNLNDGYAYDLYLYSMGTFAPGSSNNTRFTFNTVQTFVTGLPENPAIGGAFNDATTDSVGNYVMYQKLTSTSGVLSGTFAGTNQRFNGFQLVVYTPEPSSLAVLGLGAIGLMTRARRGHGRYMSRTRAFGVSIASVAGKTNSLMLILIAAFVCLISGGVASATVLNVDFNQPPASEISGTYNALAAAPDSPSNTFWNGVNVGTTSFTSGVNALTYSDSTTVATGISFSLSHFLAFDTKFNFGYSTSFANALFGEIVYDPDGTAGTNGSLTINGLNDGYAYDLYLYSMTGYPNSNDSTFIVNSVSTSVTGLPSSYSSFDDATADTTGNYVLYSKISSASNAISVDFSGGNERFNGFQLVVYTPEPSSLAILGLGVIGLTKRARRGHAR